AVDQGDDEGRHQRHAQEGEQVGDGEAHVPPRRTRLRRIHSTASGPDTAELASHSSSSAMRPQASPRSQGLAAEPPAFSTQGTWWPKPASRRLTLPKAAPRRAGAVGEKRWRL